MGYVVNKRRFKQSGPIFLLPYSDKSKVITYLTPDNFKGSSSTTWGDEYSRHMTRDRYSTWELAADGKSVCVYPSNSGIRPVSISAPANLYNFTLYIVAQYSGTNIQSSGTEVRFRAVSPSPRKTADIFRDNSYSSIQSLGSNFTSWRTNNYRYFNASALDSFQTYALSFQKNNQPIHVLNDSKATFPYNGENYPDQFYFDTSGSNHHKVCIKLLAIVSEAESETVLQNNVNFIRNQLHLT